MLSAECAGWARTAGYEVRVDREATVLSPLGGGRSCYRLQRRGDAGRVELSETNIDGMTEILLFAVDMDVTERFLIGALATTFAIILTCRFSNCRGVLAISLSGLRSAALRGGIGRCLGLGWGRSRQLPGTSLVCRDWSRCRGSCCSRSRS